MKNDNPKSTAHKSVCAKGAQQGAKHLNAKSSAKLAPPQKAAKAGAQTSAKLTQESEKVGAKVRLTQRDIAGILKIDTKTLYNWRKHKPELYAVVMLGFKFKELLERQKSYTKELEDIEQNLDERLKAR